MFNGQRSGNSGKTVWVKGQRQITAAGASDISRTFWYTPELEVCVLSQLPTFKQRQRQNISTESNGVSSTGLHLPRKTQCLQSRSAGVQRCWKSKQSRERWECYLWLREGSASSGEFWVSLKSFHFYRWYAWKFMGLVIMKWQVTKAYEKEKRMLMVLVVNHDVWRTEPGKFPEVLCFLINLRNFKTTCAL